jgi:hypothetical protein
VDNFGNGSVRWGFFSVVFYMDFKMLYRVGSCGLLTKRKHFYASRMANNKLNGNISYFIF